MPLSRKEHKLLTAQLNKEFRRLTKKQLERNGEIRKIYQKVYAGHPEWLDELSKIFD